MQKAQQCLQRRSELPDHGGSLRNWPAALELLEHFGGDRVELLLHLEEDLHVSDLDLHVFSPW